MFSLLELKQRLKKPQTMKEVAPVLDVSACLSMTDICNTILESLRDYDFLDETSLDKSHVAVGNKIKNAYGFIDGYLREGGSFYQIELEECDDGITTLNFSHYLDEEKTEWDAYFPSDITLDQLNEELVEPLVFYIDSKICSLSKY